MLLPVVAGAILILTYLILAIGRAPYLRIDRTGAAIVGATLMVATGVLTLDAAYQAIDYRTLVLLFGMMVLIAHLRMAGFFRGIVQWVAAHIRQPRALLAAIVFVSGILSALFVNDTICLVFTPILIDVAETRGQRPLPYLLALVTGSNIGSVATITGNPQNMLIGSLSGISYGHFLSALGPIALFGLCVDALVLMLLFRDDLRTPPTARADTAARPTGGGPLDPTATACATATATATAPIPVPVPAGIAATAAPLADAQASEACGPSATRPARPMHRALLIKSLLVSLGVVAAFLAGVEPALVSAVAAAALLITRRVKPRKVYEQIDWDLLVLFVGLFVVVHGVEHVGLARELFVLLEPIGLHTVAGLSLVSTIVSNVISNVPAVMLIARVVPDLPHPETAWLTLAMSSTLAGNLTLLGSIANLIVLEGARRRQVEITFWAYLKVGAPVTLLTLAFGMWWLAR